MIFLFWHEVCYNPIQGLKEIFRIGGEEQIVY